MELLVLFVVLAGFYIWSKPPKIPKPKKQYILEIEVVGSDNKEIDMTVGTFSVDNTLRLRAKKTEVDRFGNKISDGVVVAATWSVDHPELATVPGVDGTSDVNLTPVGPVGTVVVTATVDALTATLTEVLTVGAVASTTLVIETDTPVAKV